uniref:Uncharacterized protein n=1 Tax=Oryza glumipatula TaxID=40148 RepID=A0A0E0ATB0_9ORYZ
MPRGELSTAPLSLLPLPPLSKGHCPPPPRATAFCPPPMKVARNQNIHNSVVFLQRHTDWCIGDLSHKPLLPQPNTLIRMSHVGVGGITDAREDMKLVE